jgi:beta-galactosidase
MRMTGLRAFLALAVLAAVGGSATAQPAPSNPRTTLPFDDAWRFSVTLPDAAQAQAPDFSDADWRQLSLPHDWSIEAGPDRANRSGTAGAFMPGGTGWYRKHFTLPASAAGKRVSVEFDGVMHNWTCWINGKELGTRPYGYAAVRYDLTDALKPGADNLLVVKVDDATQPAARWYAGSGIERHVRLLITDPLHVQQWSTFITTPQVTADAATVHLETALLNQNPSAVQAGLQLELLAPDGASVARVDLPAITIEPGKSAPFSRDITVSHPALWGMDSPQLYTAVVRVKSAAATVDEEKTPFGIRTFEFKSETGFWLNGKNIKLYGVCLHADGGGIGAAVPMGIWERRLKALKQVGVNAVRTAHNAPDPEFLALCDRMGMVVMHELFDAWTARKVPGDYARFFDQWHERDLTDVLMRDRNHPSIVIYSAGNEIHDSQDKQKQILPGLIAIYKKVDPTRPVTQALFRPENPGGAYSNGIAEMLDVVGTNYRPNLLADYVKQHPGSKVIGTEDNYRALELQVMRDSPALSGEMLWAGIDYLGEGIGGSISQGFGLFDRTIEPRLRAFERQAWWTSAPMVKIGRTADLPNARGRGERGGGQVMDWTPASTDPHEETVLVQSNCEEVELLLNGKSLGSQKRPADWAPRSWKVPFQPGSLKAVAKNAGREVATDELRSAGKAVRIQLTVDQPTLSPAWDDVAIVRAQLVDDHGVVNPNDSAKITFKTDGPALLAAVDNADLDSFEKFRGNERSTWRGKCIAIIKATGPGKITVSATAQGLEPGTATLDGVAH